MPKSKPSESKSKSKAKSATKKKPTSLKSKSASKSPNKAKRMAAIPSHPEVAPPKPRIGEPTIHYYVSIPKPSTHNLEIEIDLGALQPGEVQLRLPSWTPGSYKIREFARNVSHFRVIDQRGRAIPHRQTAKDTWTFTVGKSGAAKVAYRLYSFELSVRTPHVDDTHAFFQPTNALMYVEGFLAAPSVLTIDPPKGWRVYCPLPLLKGAANSYVAASYDILGDSPVECGAHESIAFDVDGKRHEIVTHGSSGVDLRQMAGDFAKIVRAAKHMYGDVLPYDNYTFILHFLPNNRGGLEHLNSQVSAWALGKLETREQYEDFLSLISHEFFHLWNVKRIRPANLGPFDYTTEQYTDQLWVMEGITSYYEWLILARAGLITKERVWKAIEAELVRWEERPANAVVPLDEAGRLAWTKLYLADENFVNTGVSYYLKGNLVAGLLDMEIRRRTNNRKSLDDVMRRLYAVFGWPKPGFPDGAFERVAEEVAGCDLSAFWARNLRSTEPLALSDWFDTVGLTISREAVMKIGPDNTMVMVSEMPWAGWETGTAVAGVMITSIRDGSPASLAGLSAKDEIMAIDGRRVSTMSDVDAKIKATPVGGTVEVTVFRDGRLLSFRMKPVPKPAGKIRLMPVANPTEAQVTTMQSWLGPTIA